ncbi:hypothetical protein CKM354_000148500 [Cercospora kikuchii]|uniref:Heterokaryon incompatibility domain-containing protein n=1 Tax=Cercospora kikuchii TaxID=84275 RepID=A0A9P3C7Y4_9PEZI|nr:uncharacterized protein CKM354_000148500 [Cercospora kikuchii]GIZ38059.1 hypothetical protein CKM354_000148500 [Cercospora kikuchii]
MWLINTDTLELEEFFEPAIPSYAILSHRWTNHETTFKDYKKGRKLESLGHRKTVDFCAVARSRGHPYAWIDTACIDKQSSSELSEAINSMYRWYQMSAECLVHLADVMYTDIPPRSGKLTERLHQQLCLSDWFTRGWTLQELIAPRCVLFFTQDWKLFGCKSTASRTINGFRANDTACMDLADALSSITSIPKELLTFQWPLEEYTIAARAKWLANRKVTRIEDQAYCALGLFGVNMGLLYGEGKRAWSRLQEEIVRNSHDESIFAWPMAYGSRAQPRFSSSPAPFSVVSPTISTVYGLRPLYTITNQGLRWDLEPGSAIIGKLDLSRIPRFDSRSKPMLGDMRALMLPLACLYENQPTSQEYLLLIELACGHYMRVPSRDTLRLPLPLADLIRRGKIAGPWRLGHAMTIFVHLRSDHSKGCTFAYNQLLMYQDLHLLVVQQFYTAIDAAIHQLRRQPAIQYQLAESGLATFSNVSTVLECDDGTSQDMINVGSNEPPRPISSSQNNSGIQALERLRQLDGIARMVNCLHGDCIRKGNYGFNREDKMREHMRQVHGYLYNARGDGGRPEIQIFQTNA